MLHHMITAETRLFFREPGVWLLTILLPTIVLVAVGLVFGVEPDPGLGGLRWIDIFAPSMVVMTLAILGVNLLPARLVKYREKGVLRRLSTTPASPRSVLIAQLVVNMGVAVVSLAVLLVVGNLVFGIPLPRDPVGFAVAFLLGMSALFALGLLVAAVAPSAGIASALFVPLFALVMLLGGVYLPRTMLPELLIRIGDYTPPGVQALLDAWQGTSPQLAQLAVMALITVLAGAAAAKRFRWE
jgi:ABC-2 type transport system permease protein